MDILRILSERISVMKAEFHRFLSPVISAFTPGSGEMISSITSGSDEIPVRRRSAREVSGLNSQSASDEMISSFTSGSDEMISSITSGSDEIPIRRRSSREVCGLNSQSASDEMISSITSGSDEIPIRRRSSREVSGFKRQSASGVMIYSITSGSDEIPVRRRSAREVSGLISQSASDEMISSITSGSDEIPVGRRSSREVSGLKRQSASGLMISSITSGSDEIPERRRSSREVSGLNSQSASDEIPVRRRSSREVSGLKRQSASGEMISSITSGSDEITGRRRSAREVNGLHSQSVSGPLSSSCQSIARREPVMQELPIGAHNPQADGKLTIQRLPLNFTPNSVNSQAKTRKCVYGNRSPASLREKTVMVVGGTGTGKSTMINSVVNHIMGIQWEDNFRLSVIDPMQDEMENSSDESNQQTEWITCYAIPEDESMLDYTLNIIDTPGFGDTSGIDRDRELVDHLRVFFNSSGEQGIEVLDAVWFVAKSYDTRLSQSLKYVFDSILSIFGIDIGKSIFVLVTFADNKNPQVLKTLKAAKVPFQNAFAFNNSALFENKENPEMNACGQHYWARNTEYFRQLFDELGKTERHSIKLSAEVLRIRKQLETIIQGMHMHVHDGLRKMDRIKQEENIVKHHTANLSMIGNYEYELEEDKPEKIDITEKGQFATNCEQCKRTCHFPCSVPKNEDKANCLAMNNGNCTVCKDKCAWNHHYNSSWRFEIKTVKVKKTYEEIKRRYMEEQKDVQTHQSLLESIKQDYKETERNVSDAITLARESLTRLKKIALKEDPLSHVEYIEQLIKCEEREKKPRYLERIDVLHAIKEQAQLLAKCMNIETSHIRINT